MEKASSVSPTTVKHDKVPIQAQFIPDPKEKVEERNDVPPDSWWPSFGEVVVGAVGGVLGMVALKALGF